jgi:hypothetical protein
MSSLQYIVFGRVLPERSGMGMNGSPRLAFDWMSQKVEVELSFLHSHITVKLFTQSSDWSDGEILSASRQTAGLFTTLVAYKLCAAYQIVFDQILRHATGAHSVVSVTEPIFHTVENSKFTFRPLGDFEPFVPNFDALNDPRVAVAMDELNIAILRPSLTAMHTYICLEYIKELHGDGSEADKWTAMRTNLNVSRECLMEIENLAKDMKHGKIMFTSWDQRKRCLQIAWEVMHRQLLRIDGSKDIFEELD